MSRLSISCRTSSVSKFGRYISVTLYPLVGLIILFAALFLVFDAIGNPENVKSDAISLLIMTIVSIGISVWLLKLGVSCYQFETREIFVDQHGVVVKGRKESSYEWNQIGGISVVAFAATASRQHHQEQICIFLRPFKQKHLKKIYTSYLYGVLNLEEFVLLDFDPVLLEVLSKYSGLEIVDKRYLQK